jgi:hypothetical protein
MGLDAGAPTAHLYSLLSATTMLTDRGAFLRPPAAFASDDANDHPVYLSARSADVILSEIRSTRLKVEALQAINDLLDEIILLVIQGARSFSPAKLKDSFLKLCPTPLGKESVLEAEVELRNHRDRGIPSTPTPYDDLSSARDFPVELAFEVSLDPHSGPPTPLTFLVATPS